jgi:hypothetical protein
MKKQKPSEKNSWKMPGVFLALLLLSLVFGMQLYGRSGTQQWSQTNPEINLGHIFEGAINSRGRPTGFHSRPGGKDPQHARLNKLLSPPNSSGVYTAKVEIYDPREKHWKEKFSTLFPDSMTRQQVIQAVLHAWKHRSTGNKTKWQGPSGTGFTIQGYLNRRSNINTAYPIYTKK